MLLSKNEIHKLCIETAAKSPCAKRKVGAVLVEILPADKELYKVLATGYNHNPIGSICETVNGETLDEVIHAEVACVKNHDFKLTALNAKLHMFVTFEPCASCLAQLTKLNISYEVVGEFMKFDKTKLRMALVPASLGQACARALQYGAKKYKVDNWRNTPDIESFISALQRHFDDWREGKENDVESGLSHLDHMAANLAFLIELKNLPKIKDETKLIK